MQVSSVAIGAIVLAAAAVGIRSQTSPPPVRVATFDIETAIMKTQEGQQAVSALQARFNPKRLQLEKEQAAIQGLQAQLQKGAATLSAQAQADLQRELESAGRKYKHDAEDVEAESTQEQARLGQVLESKMGAVVDKYARTNNYAVILNMSNQPAPAFWAANSADITEEMVKLYDEAHPAPQPKKP